MLVMKMSCLIVRVKRSLFITICSTSSWNRILIRVQVANLWRNVSAKRCFFFARLRCSLCRARIAALVAEQESPVASTDRRSSSDNVRNTSHGHRILHGMQGKKSIVVVFVLLY